MISMKSYIATLSHSLQCLLLAGTIRSVSSSIPILRFHRIFGEFSFLMAYDMTTMTWVSGYIIAEKSMCQYVKYVKYITTS